MATFAISDIHGNSAGLDELLAQIEPELQPADTVVFIGDYIDRGPDTRGCIERVLTFTQEAGCSVVPLLGNHEQWLLRTLDDYRRHSWILGMEAFDTIASYSAEAADQLREELIAAGPGLLEGAHIPYEFFFDHVPRAHLRFLGGLSLYCRTEDGVFVHGGLDPSGGPVEAQSEEALVWGHDSFPDEYRGSDVIVYGHVGNARLDESGRSIPYKKNKTIGIDTSGHGVVTAIRLPDEAVSQSARYTRDE
jgi:serine/threonine protein phosphatase 1